MSTVAWGDAAESAGRLVADGWEKGRTVAAVLTSETVRTDPAGHTWVVAHQGHVEATLPLGLATERDWASTFSKTFASPASAVQERIWAEVYGDEYPSGLDTFSYITKTELTRFAHDAAVGPGMLMVDVGCGTGGPGLWVAAQTGARLIGVDIADTAVAKAQERATSMGLGDRAEFRLGTFEATGLDTGTVDAVMSVDALLFTPDKGAALKELARVVRPHARLVATTWDYHRQPVGRPPQVADHRPLLEQAGFVVVAYDEAEAWHERQTRIDERLLDSVDELAEESGEDPALVRSGLEEMHATLACMNRRVIIVAERVA